MLVPLAWTAGSIGVAGVGVFAAAGLMSLATYSSLREKCGDAPCGPAQADELARGKTQQLVANIGAGIAVAGLFTGATLWAVAAQPNRAADPASPPSAPKVGLSVGPASVTLSGTF